MRIRARDCKSQNRPQEIEAAETQTGKDAEQQDRDNKQRNHKAGEATKNEKKARDEVKNVDILKLNRKKESMVGKFMLTELQLFSNSDQGEKEQS